MSDRHHVRITLDLQCCIFYLEMLIVYYTYLRVKSSLFILETVTYVGVGVMVGQVLANTCFPVDQSHAAHKLNGVYSSHHSPLHKFDFSIILCTS